MKSCAPKNGNFPQNVPNVQVFLARAFGARVYRIPNCSGARTKICLRVCVILEGFENIARLCTFKKLCTPKDLVFHAKCAKCLKFFSLAPSALAYPMFHIAGGRARNLTLAGCYWESLFWWIWRTVIAEALSASPGEKVQACTPPEIRILGRGERGEEGDN